jgi:hypothetical protein
MAKNKFRKDIREDQTTFFNLRRLDFELNINKKIVIFHVGVNFVTEIIIYISMIIFKKKTGTVYQLQDPIKCVNRC